MSPPTPFRRRGAVAIVAAAVLLVGCARTPPGTAAGQVQFTPAERLATALAPDRVGLQAEAFERAREADAPVMIAAIEREGTAARMLRLSSRDGVEIWRSIDNAALTLRSGLLIATRGFGDDLLSADTAGAEVLVLAGRAGRVNRVHRRLDGEDGVEIAGYVCDVARRGPRQIVLAGGNVDTVLMEEVCHGPAGGFINLYWTNGGRVVQSRQWAGAGTGTLSLQDVPS